MKRKRAAAPRPSWIGRRLRACLRVPLRHPLRTAVSVTVVGLSAMIVVNAVELQTARHPSPLFGSFPAPPKSPAAQAAAVPVGLPQPPKNDTPAGPKRDINSLLGQRRNTAFVPLPRPKQPPPAAGQAAGQGVTVR